MKRIPKMPALLPEYDQSLPFSLDRVYYASMSKPSAYFLIILVIFAVCFTTWQLFRGNLEAAFASLPLLLVTYFFLKLNRSDRH